MSEFGIAALVLWGSAVAILGGTLMRAHYDRKRAKRYTIAVDFDGVLHAYTTPWIAPHVIPDPPVEGALQWILDRMHDDFHVVIHTTRARTWRGRRAIRAWLRQHGGEGMYYEVMGFAGLEDVAITHRKVPALVYIDDRAWRFDGKNWPSKEDVHRARPWNKP